MPAGMPVTAGCEEGKSARNCVQMNGPDEAVVMPPVGGNITDYALIAIYEPGASDARHPSQFCGQDAVFFRRIVTSSF